MGASRHTFVLIRKTVTCKDWLLICEAPPKIQTPASDLFYRGHSGLSVFPKLPFNFSHVSPSYSQVKLTVPCSAYLVVVAFELILSSQVLGSLPEVKGIG